MEVALNKECINCHGTGLDPVLGKTCEACFGAGKQLVNYESGRMPVHMRDKEDSGEV